MGLQGLFLGPIGDALGPIDGPGPSRRNLFGAAAVTAINVAAANPGPHATGTRILDPPIRVEAVSSVDEPRRLMRLPVGEGASPLSFESPSRRGIACALAPP